MREDWVPIKLDVSVDMPDVLDISSLRGNGPQSGEELLPELDTRPPEYEFDQDALGQLAEMGFPIGACKRALFFTKNGGLEAASTWLMEHITDSDFGEPFVVPGTQSSSLDKFVPDAEALSNIVMMGFTEQQGAKALKATDNNMARAVDWIFSHQDELNSEEAPAGPEFRDGNSSKTCNKWRFLFEYNVMRFQNINWWHLFRIWAHQAWSDIMSFIFRRTISG